MRWIGIAALAALAAFMLAQAADAQEQAAQPPPAISIPVVEAFDTPNDSGRSILLRWSVLKNDTPEVKYIVEVSESADGPFEKVTEVAAGASLCSSSQKYFGFDNEANKEFQFVELLLEKEEPKEKGQGKFKGENGKEYFFRLTRTEGEEKYVHPKVVSAVAGANWFNLGKLNSFVLAIIFCFIVMFFISYAKRNPNLFIRKIAGLDAVEEAIGRATEMGKPIFYLTGLGVMSELPTIASVNILGQVAKKVADHDTILKVPSRDPIVMSVCQEVVKEAFTSVGRPDAYNEDNIFFITQDQFAFTAAVDGMMMREKPATVFLMGYFYAESLLLAEAGSSIGAIQIAGTDAYVQLPFFITTCDYVLIGEELYAASAYLSRESTLLGSLRGQDVGKALLVLIIIIGIILSSAGSVTIANLLTEF